MNARQSSRLLSLVLFAALCALLTHWVLTLSSLRSLGAPRESRVAQTDALETGAAVTLFGGGPQNGPRDVQVMGVVADLADGSGAAIVSVDGGAPQAVRAGKSLSSNIKLVEIKARSVVIERHGARQENPQPASALGGGRRPIAMHRRCRCRLQAPQLRYRRPPCHQRRRLPTIRPIPPCRAPCCPLHQRRSTRVRSLRARAAALSALATAQRPPHARATPPSRAPTNRHVASDAARQALAGAYYNGCHWGNSV